MRAYLTDLDALRVKSSNGDALNNAMLQKYPDFAVRRLLWFGAQGAFKP